MRISIMASGSRGDVQPYVALGKGLKAAGHHVRILSSIDFEQVVNSAGLEFCASGESVEALLNTEEWRKTSEGGNFLKIVQKMRQEMQTRAKDFAEKLPSLLEDSDLILGGIGGLGGAFSIAEKLQIPFIQAYLFPISPTKEFSSPLTPVLPFGKVLNRSSFQLLRFALWQTVSEVDGRVRKQLALRKRSFRQSFKTLDAHRNPVLYAYSQHVLAKPSDWDERKHVTGYWFLDAEDNWQAPRELLDFLTAGSPPVYIGFGSMGNRNPQEAAEIALKALKLSGQRGIIAAGWGGLLPNQVPDSVYMISGLPHSWLFPKMAAVVHHGGAGTTAAGLRASIPSIIVPFMGDQGFWGQKVYDLGVGTRPIPRKKLNAENLAAAIKEALTNASIAQKARELGQKIATEEGIEKAVALIE